MSVAGLMDGSGEARGGFPVGSLGVSVLQGRGGVSVLRNREGLVVSGLVSGVFGEERPLTPTLSPGGAGGEGVSAREIVVPFHVGERDSVQASGSHLRDVAGGGEVTT